MKKALIVAFLFAALAAAPHAIAQSQGTFVPLTNIPGLTDIQPDTGGLATFFNNLYKYLIGLSAALAVIMIIRGGLEYSTQDSVSSKEAGKEHIKQAILGLVLVLSPVLVFSIINPSILNLSINFQKLDNTPTNPTTGPTNPGGGTQGPTAGNCTVTGGNYLKTATCAGGNGTDAKTLANQWIANNCNTLFFGLFGSDTSDVTCTASNSSGCQQATVSCEGQSPQSYLLMDIGPKSKTSANLQPFDAQTSSDLSGFISGCAGDGGSVCTNQTTALLSGTSCPSYTSTLPSGASGKCFKQSYYCFTQADAAMANGLLSKITDFTSSNNSYICQPNLQFTLTPRT